VDERLKSSNKAFPPSNTDIFIAAADGSNARPLVPDRALDYNASFSADGQWIVFTSHRAGSADLYRIRPDGSGLERLTDDPAFDDQGAFSPDGKQNRVRVDTPRPGGHLEARSGDAQAPTCHRGAGWRFPSCLFAGRSVDRVCLRSPARREVLSEHDGG
jgi:WD40-like Beta Propeller Repeat